jgi:hypothetical protein
VWTARGCAPSCPLTVIAMASTRIICLHCASHKPSTFPASYGGSGVSVFTGLSDGRRR